jgi:integrase
MARERLTDKRVAAMQPAAAGRREVFDTVKTGLSLRITQAGVKSWCVLYRFDGELRRHTLDHPYPRIGLAEARTLAGEVLELVARGRDPRKVRAERAVAAEQRAADTIAAVAEQFITRYASQRRWRELTRVLRRDVVPEWGGRPAAEITRREVIEFVERIAARAPIQGNRTLVVLKIFFGWALDRDIIASDPTARVRKPTKEYARERVLDDAEIVAFWRACERLGWPFGPLLQLLLLTAQRKSEIAHLTRREVVSAERLIEIAGSKYKTGRPQVVPLCATALAIIDALPVLGDLLFTANGRTPVSAFSGAKTALDRLMLEELRRDAPEATLPLWTVHDLRRTARTNFSKLRIPSDIGERILGHAIPGVRGRYDRHEYLDEKRDALDRWAAHLDGLLHPRPDNVTSLPQRQRP